MTIDFINLNIFSNYVIAKKPLTNFLKNYVIDIYQIFNMDTSLRLQRGILQLKCIIEL